MASTYALKLTKSPQLNSIFKESFGRCDESQEQMLDYHKAMKAMLMQTKRRSVAIRRVGAGRLRYSSSGMS
jgi:hypothetical protein